jgi:Sec23/Sec24 trunk domain
MLLSAVEGIKYLLFGGVKTIDPNAKIAIVTFDCAIHFYNMQVNYYSLE